MAKKPLTEYFVNRKNYDEEDEHGANRTAQITIATGSAVYLGIFVLVLLDMTRYSVGQYLVLLGIFAAAVLLNVALHPLLAKKAPWLIKYFLMGNVFVACASLQASTQLLAALFLALPILLACRYHDKDFMLSVFLASFVMVVLKEVICYKIGMYDLNVISVVDHTFILKGSEFRTYLIPYINMDTYFWDVALFSVLPQWVELAVLSVVAILLGNNGRALRAHQRDSIRREAAVESELNSAKEIQMGLLPNDFALGNGFDLYASSTPAKNVGGDFYDCFMIDEHHLAVTVADVSGKGMPAALFMATTKMCIRDYVAMGLAVGEVFTRVNRAVCTGNTRGMFVTAWLGILDLQTGVLDFVNAGHNPPLIKNGAGKYHYLTMRTNLILGAFDGYRYKGERLTLAPGDGLLLYTDGVTESRTKDAELFGEARLEELLVPLAEAESRSIVSSVKKGVTAFAGDAEQYDDITLLALRFTGLGEEPAIRVFPAQMEEYPAAKAFLEEELGKLGVSRPLTQRLFVAADELFTNVAKYAYPNKDGSLEIRIVKTGEKLAVSFIDGGLPFDPLVKKQESVYTETGELRIGGLGLTMVKHMMDEVRYSYVENKNIVTVINDLTKTEE